MFGLDPCWLPVILLGCQMPACPLLDPHGGSHPIQALAGSRATVLLFLGVDCPLAKAYAPKINLLTQNYSSRGVAFVGINSDAHTGLSSLARFVKQHQVTWPFMKDEKNLLADRLLVQHTPEAFVFDGSGRLRYRGRIDDQFRAESRRPQPSSHELVNALEAVLANKSVTRPYAAPTGCQVNRLERNSAPGGVSYSRDVAPILQEHCQACHRPGQIGPFSLLNYEDAIAQAETIGDVVRAGRMPPWHANPLFGSFVNARVLSTPEKKTILDWIDRRCPEGDRAALPPPLPPASEWAIGRPDAIISMPYAVTVPPEGDVPYQYFEIDPGFREDQWIQAAEVLPGNRAVVHHCNVLLKPPTEIPLDPASESEWRFFAGMTPGKDPLVLRPGIAKRWPAGWRAVFVVHYAPIGSPQTDLSRLGLVLANPDHLRQEVFTHLTDDPALKIPPRSPDHVVEHTFQCPGDLQLLSIFPHMHVRGKAFRCEAEYPNGEREILLDVPRYDFAWQHQYVLTAPKSLPAGTVLHYVAHYDNSADNSANPNPEATVSTGLQSWEEMFNAYIDFTYIDQDLQAPARIQVRWILGLAVLACAGCLMLARRLVSP